MSNELTTWDMQISPIILSNVYLNVPSDKAYPLFYHSLINLVAEIGKKHGNVKGSDLKKGICFLKEQTNCSSTRQIKMMLRSTKNSFIREKYDKEYIFRCSKRFYPTIFDAIIKISQYSTKSSYLDELIPNTIDGLNYVAQFGYNDETINSAKELLKQLEAIEEKYQEGE